MTSSTARPVVPDAARVCLGRCNNDVRRAQQRYRDALDTHDRALTAWSTLAPDVRGERPRPPEAPILQPALGEPTWCPRCVAEIRRALASLDDLAAMLAAECDGHRPQRLDAVQVTTSRTVPSVASAVDDLDELYGALAAFEDWWRAACGYASRPPRGRGALARTLTVTWLLGQLDAILAQPDSVQFGLDVLGWRRRLEAATKSQPNERLTARCTRCSMRSLFRGDRYVECAGCGKLFTDDEYDVLVAEQEHVAGARKVIPTADTGK